MGNKEDLGPIQLSFKPVCRTPECIKPVYRGVYCQECGEESTRQELKRFTETLSRKSFAHDRQNGRALPNTGRPAEKREQRGSTLTARG